MSPAPFEPTFTLDQTGPNTWDVLMGGSVLVAGTITQAGDSYVLADAQNLPRGSYGSVLDACAALADGEA